MTKMSIVQKERPVVHRRRVQEARHNLAAFIELCSPEICKSIQPYQWDLIKALDRIEDNGKR